VRLEAGRLEFRPSARAPRSLAGDLQHRLRDWPGVRLTVSISNEPGQPTLAEQKRSAKAARIESVMQAPVVRAVLDRFPGAEIVAVRDVIQEEATPSAPEADLAD
jgi:DNA polymerase-3 subunit gamma/tau